MVGKLRLRRVGSRRYPESPHHSAFPESRSPKSLTELPVSGKPPGAQRKPRALRGSLAKHPLDLSGMTRKVAAMTSEQIQVLQAEGTGERYDEDRVKALFNVCRTLLAIEDLNARQKQFKDAVDDGYRDLVAFREQLAQKIAALGDDDGPADDMDRQP